MRIYFLIATLIIFAACHKEASITPDPTPPPMYKLPQGNSSYDDTIVAFHKKYGSYILYKFTQHDFNYNYSDKRTDTAYMGDPAYISPALIFLQQQLFNGYSDAFLQKTMPLKILLASRIVDTLGGLKDAASTSSMMAFGWANSTLQKKTAAELRQMRAKIHRTYMERAYRAGALAIPDDFMTTAPTSYGAVTDVNKYALGVVEIVGQRPQLNIATDYLGYIEMITGNSYTALTSPGQPLHPAVDVKGLVRKRYTIILNDFANNYGVDLQAIGNLP